MTTKELRRRLKRIIRSELRAAGVLPPRVGRPVLRDRGQRSFQGEDGKWGVEGSDGAILYEADFDDRRTTDRLAELENGKRPLPDWETARDILEAEGLPT